VRFLGSYPRADRQRASIAPLTSDADFSSARDWLTGIRSGRP
jgi:prephenate dehydratase